MKSSIILFLTVIFQAGLTLAQDIPQWEGRGLEVICQIQGGPTIDPQPTLALAIVQAEATCVSALGDWCHNQTDNQLLDHRGRWTQEQVLEIPNFSCQSVEVEESKNESDFGEEIMNPKCLESGLHISEIMALGCIGSPY